MFCLQVDRQSLTSHYWGLSFEHSSSKLAAKMFRMKMSFIPYLDVWSVWISFQETIYIGSIWLWHFTWKCFFWLIFHHCFRLTIKMCSLIHKEFNLFYYVMILSNNWAILSCYHCVFFSSRRFDCCTWLRIEEELPNTEMDFSINKTKN